MNSIKILASALSICFSINVAHADESQSTDTVTQNNNLVNQLESVQEPYTKDNEVKAPESGQEIKDESDNSQYFIVDGSIDLVKILANESQENRDPVVAYETARFAKFVSDSAIKAKMEGFNKIIIVNLPSYVLYAINLESGISEIESKVIIGKKVAHSRTPRISTNIKSITLNPTWTPPQSVLKRSIYPSLGQKGGYSDKHELVINKNGYLLPLSTPGITREDIQGYRIYQPAGVNNSLGRIRFNTDNNMNIYLHDTNQRYLFKNEDRAYSLGCVRVQDWEKLAMWISGWTKEWLNENIQKKASNNDFLTKTYIVDKVNVSIGYYPIKQDKEGKWVQAKNVYNIEE